MPNRYRATCNFTAHVDGQEVHLIEGEERVENDAVVLQHPELFEPSESATPDSDDLAEDATGPVEGMRDDEITVDYASGTPEAEQGEAEDQGDEPSDVYDELNVQELRAEASRREVPGRGDMSKAELQAALREHDRAARDSK